MDPMTLGLVAGGVNALGSSLGIFGGSKDRFIDNEYNKRAAEYYRQQAQQAKVGYERGMSNAVSVYNQQAQQTGQQAIAAASNSGLSADNAVISALKRSSRAGNIGTLMQGQQGAINQYTDTLGRVGQGTAALAQQLMYDQEPDTMTKISMAMKQGMGGMMSGYVGGNSLGEGLKGMSMFDLFKAGSGQLSNTPLQGLDPSLGKSLFSNPNWFKGNTQRSIMS